MRRTSLALAGALAAAGALTLAGCPLPQPLPDYPAGSITPPRILTDPLFAGNSPIIFVPSDCLTTAPQYALSASVSDSNTIEPVEARWFVNYDIRYPLNRMWQQQETIQPNADTANLVRSVSAFRFEPYGYPPAPDTPSSTGLPTSDPGVLRIVELVVSNGFDPSGVQTSLPNRTPLPGFETQVHRWVFLTKAGLPCPTP